MIRHRSTIAAALVAAGFSVFAGASAAHADTALGIQTSPNADLPLVGHQVCDMLTTAVTGNPNPVPAVRGVVQTLQTNNMTREQAVGLMKVAVVIYCPQNARYTGR
jgi:hypothetical protein